MIEGYIVVFRRFPAPTRSRPKAFGDGILRCCSKMGLHPSEAVYVGDTPTNARAVVDALCRAAIRVLWGSNHAERLSEEEGFEVLCGNA